jgi:CRISPR-associated protein Cas2
MAHLICYDITQNSLRTRIGKKIIEYGLDRINKSVYLGTVSKSSLTQLENWLSQEISAKGDATDSCIVVRVSAEQVQQMRILGLNELDLDELSGDKSTLIL